MMRINNYSATRSFVPITEKPYECDRLIRYFCEKNKELAKLANRMSSVFCVLGLVFCGSLGVGASPVPFSLVIAGICFAFALLSVNSKNKYKRMDAAYYAANMYVSEGIVTDLRGGSNMPDSYRCWFTSNDGQISEGWYRVRKENVSVGTSLLLVYVTRKQPNKYEKCVFSPFMLTEEGLKLHW